MKKIIFVLAIFIAAPAFALDVSLVDNEDGTVSIMYSGADANATSTMPRAFALEITIDSPGTITDVLNYKNDIAHDNNGVDETGESNSVYPGFGIYPAQITWFPPSGGDPRDVNEWGSPLANQSDPGHGDTLPGANIVLEFGSLYYGDSNEPRAEGKLCDLVLSCNTGENLNIVMVDEDAYRGGLVFEDGTQGDIDSNTIVCDVVDECLNSAATEYTKWGNYGKPDCWCYQKNCRGDADGLKTFLKPVMNPDLTIFKAAFNKTAAYVQTLVVGSTPGICADFDRADTFLKPVMNPDLTIFKAYFNLADGLVPVCDQAPVTTGPYNFWTN